MASTSGDMEASSAETIARAQLRGKEKLIWAGRPDVDEHVARARPGARYWGAVGAGLVMIAALAWWPPTPSDTASVDPEVRSAAVVLLGPILLIAFIVLPSLAPYRAKRRAQRTVYVVSNRRVMEILGATPNREKERKYCRAVRLSNLKPDGTGDVAVEGRAGQHTPLVFVAVPHAEWLAQRIETTLLGTRKPSKT